MKDTSEGSMNKSSPLFTVGASPSACPMLQIARINNKSLAKSCKTGRLDWTEHD
jgi:hypothetical protein